MAASPPKAEAYRLEAPAVLERNGARLVLPKGTEIIVPEGGRLEPESPHTVWN